jgi:Uncharacterised ACR, YagE family COG1723
MSSSAWPTKTLITTRTSLQHCSSSASLSSSSSSSAAAGGATGSTTERTGAATSSPFSSSSKDRGGGGVAGAFVVDNHSNRQDGGVLLLPVSALHVAQTIDLYPCLSDLMARYTFRRQTSHKNSVLIELAPDSTTATTSNNKSATATNGVVPRYVALYRFGSLVFVNCPPPMVAEFAAFVKKKHAVQPVPHGLERKENYGILLQPPAAAQPPSPPSHVVPAERRTLLDPTPTISSSARDATAAASSEPPQQQLPPPLHPTTGDYCVLNELDMNGISVVSHVMAQTVALDTYNDMVDELLTKFAKINYKVTQTGLVPDSERAFLFKTIAQNHIIFNDMISKLRIKDRSDTAWNLTRYESTWYGMRDEFEMDERFENMEFKLKLIEQNAKFFVEALQSQKSSTLEWIIIVLIAVECVIMTADMTGMGEALLSPLLEHAKSWWAPGSGGGVAADVLASSSSADAIQVVDSASGSTPPGANAS